MLIFYDVDTSGTNTLFDQILGISAIEATQDGQPTGRTFTQTIRLSLNTLVQPQALVAQDRPIDDFTGLGLPGRRHALESFYAWCNETRRDDRRAGRPTLLIGWNSQHFDAKFLAADVFRALLPLGLFGDFQQHDAMRIAQMTTWTTGGSALKEATSAKNKPTYALAALAARNGLTVSEQTPPGTTFAGARLTQKVCARVAARAASEWYRHLAFADRAFVRDWLETNRRRFLHVETPFSQLDVRAARLLDGGGSPYLTADLSKPFGPAKVPADERTVPVRYLSLHAPLLLPYDPTISSALADTETRLDDPSVHARLSAGWHRKRRERLAKNPPPTQPRAMLSQTTFSQEMHEDLVRFAHAPDPVGFRFSAPVHQALADAFLADDGHALPLDRLNAFVEKTRAELLDPDPDANGDARPLSIPNALIRIDQALEDDTLTERGRGLLTDYKSWLGDRGRRLQAGDPSLTGS